MKFETFEHAHMMSKEMRVTYTGLDGQQRQKSVTLPPYETSFDMMNYARRTLERDAREDLADQAIQRERIMSRQREDVAMATAYYPSFTSGTSGTVYTNTTASTEWASATIDYASGTDSLFVNVSTDGCINVSSPEYVVEIEVPVGKRSVTVRKTITDGTKVKITEQDIIKAMQEKIENTKFQIITNRAERKAEDLLRSMISEVDFRDYKNKGYFLVRSGNKIFKIYKDKSKWIDMWEADPKRKIFVPKNRLCTHTQTRDLPDADEALSKLMLIRSESVFDHSNKHSCNNDMGHYIGGRMKNIKEKDLILV